MSRIDPRMREHVERLARVEFVEGFIGPPVAIINGYAFYSGRPPKPRRNPKAERRRELARRKLQDPNFLKNAPTAVVERERELAGEHPNEAAGSEQ